MMTNLLYNLYRFEDRHFSLKRLCILFLRNDALDDYC